VQTIADRGLRYIGGDFSAAMVLEARKGASESRGVVGFVSADAEHLPFRDHSADCVIVWRLLHHIADERVRQAMLREAARVSRARVLVSFHHPLSFTAAKKFAQRLFVPKPQHGGHVTHWQLKREAEACGLRLVETKGFRKYISVNWFACFSKAA
jgi:ubiquinone/menaquinone biosynthesis C-methylase UbiE